MVKADPKRDYYKDLELPQSADTEEIKKQFRLLAKLYHPDRNRGHEVEFVDKFQAIQAANEILSDPTEKAKYDAARVKQQQRSSAPPPPREDPYQFRRPAGPTRTQTQGPMPQSTPQPKQKPRPTFNIPRDPREPPSSAGAEKLNAFTRGPPPQTWTKERYEEAARAEAARGFSTMRQPPPPQMPPRPPRQHPTAPRPPSVGTAAAEQQYSQNHSQNGFNQPFPGMARTARTRKQAYAEEPQQKSAYNYVRAGRPPPATQPHGAEAYTPHSPQYTRAAASPLRHTRSTEYSTRPDGRPPMYPRADGRYSSNTGEKTDPHGPGLGRSASVRNSPIDPKFGDESGPFGRSRTHQPPPPRHHSASPNFRAASFSSSSEDEGLHMRNAKTQPETRPKAQPRPRVRVRTNDGLEGQFPGTNYTKVQDEQSAYEYPPPLSHQPTRSPFPNMTSSDEPHAQDRFPFRYALTRCFGRGHSVNGLPSWAVPSTVSISKTNFGSTDEHRGSNPEHVFRPANFSHENWAEKLKSTSPVKRGSKLRRPPMSKSDNSADDAMDVDDSPAAEKPHTNGINLDDLKEQVPGKAEGLNGFDDLKTNLGWESRASARYKPDSKPVESRLKMSDYPQPPKPISPPAFDRLNDENWKSYCKTMSEYMSQWSIFETKMVEHFRLRRERFNSCMNENWISMPSDGPAAEQIDQMKGSGLANGEGGLKAGYAAYMQWLRDDEMCHAWWDRACEIHKGVMEELGQVRDKIMGNQETS